MKNTMKKKCKIILVGMVLVIISIFTGCNKSVEKDIAGKWELKCTFVNFELRYGDFGKYEYFNMSLSEDGVVNVFSYPVFTSALGSCSGLGTYSFLEEKNGQYDYAINLYTIDEKNETHTYMTRLLYNSQKDQLMLFFSEDDGLILERTDEMTTVEITTTEAYSDNYTSEYGYKCLCSSMTNSKDLVRYEDRYIGKNFSYTGQVLNFYEDDNVYLILTDENGDGLYGDNWLYAQDYRKLDKTKILETDIITIYGEFMGAATNNYPCLRFYYADIKNIY